jgi:hypothetical protein
MDDRDKIYKHAIKAAIELITAMLDMGFIDKYGKWTDAGRDYTERHFQRRFMYFINYSMRSRVHFTRDYESLYNYLKENGTIWLCESESGLGWNWKGISSFNPNYSLSLIEGTAKLMGIDIGKNTLETFDDDDMLDI